MALDIARELISGVLPGQGSGTTRACSGLLSNNRVLQQKSGVVGQVGPVVEENSHLPLKSSNFGVGIRVFNYFAS